MAWAGDIYLGYERSSTGEFIVPKFVQISGKHALDEKGRVWIYRSTRRTWYPVEHDLGDVVWF